jgi:hypothetical protein
MSSLGRFSSDPRIIHLNALKRVLKYLSGTRTYGLLFPKGGTEGLRADADASWSVTHDGKGFNGFVIRCFDCLLVWKSNKQRLTALSTAESEILAISECLREIVWVKLLLSELRPRDRLGTVELGTDSQSAMALIDSLAQTARTRHFARKLWFVRDRIITENVKVVFVPTKDMTADMLTKPVVREVLERHRGSFNLVDAAEVSEPYHALTVKNVK